MLISGPRNLKCSSWFCATVVSIIVILNQKSSWCLVFVQEFLGKGTEWFRQMQGNQMLPFLLLEGDPGDLVMGQDSEALEV